MLAELTYDKNKLVEFSNSLERSIVQVTSAIINIKACNEVILDDKTIAVETCLGGCKEMLEEKRDKIVNSIEILEKCENLESEKE